MALHNRLLIALVLVCITHVTYGALELPSSSNINSESPLRVCIQDRPPMAMCSSANTTGYTGFSVELFRVAAGLILSNGSSLTVSTPTVTASFPQIHSKLRPALFSLKSTTLTMPLC